MNTRLIAYWIITGLFCLVFLAGAAAELSGAPQALTTLAHLGYPTYLLPFLGICKILAIIAVLAPDFPLVKEWAYAGAFIDLAGAAFSHSMSGDGARQVLTPIAVLVLLVVSWNLRPASRRLPATAAAA